MPSQPAATQARRLTLRALGAALALGCLATAGLGADISVSNSAAADLLTREERIAFFEGYFDRMNALKPLTRFPTRKQWLEYRAKLRTEVLRAIGLWPLPEHAPLEPRITGRIEHEDYTVEKVYYQTLPGIFASGYLYTPKATGPANTSRLRLPAVVSPHGHWSLGAVEPVVQQSCIGLVKLGFVVFCPDSTHVTDLAIGLCPIGLMTWNNMRALDYLESLAGVDPARLGCAGQSGGGQQTMYVAALDERVKVIVPVDLVSYFRRILFAGERAHCSCNHAPGIARLTDETELAAMFAPRPSLFVCATQDWTRDFPSAEFPEIQHIYGLAGGETSCVQFDKPHNYDLESREQMYNWLNRRLRGPTNAASVSEPPITTDEPAALRALESKAKDLPGLNGAPAYFRSKYAFRAPQPARQADWKTYCRKLRTNLEKLLGEDAPIGAPAASARGDAVVSGFKVEKFLLDTEPAVSAPAWLIWPQQRSGKLPAAVVAHPSGKQALLRERAALVQGLLQAGVVVLALDTRMRGELQRNWRWNETIWGRPETGMAAHDLNAAGAWLRGRPGIDKRRVFVVGLGVAGSFALCATALDSHWAGAALDEVGLLYGEHQSADIIPNILRFGDLPQIAALGALRRLWLNGADHRFGFTQQCYTAAHCAERLRCTELAREEFDAVLPAWLAVTDKSSRTEGPSH